MRILGPLVCSSTSAVTATFSRSLAAVVTFAPSTTSATGSETESPASSSSFSTLTMSPTATLYCLPPVLTIAYVGFLAAIVLVHPLLRLRARATRGLRARVWGAGFLSPAGHRLGLPSLQTTVQGYVTSG